MSRIVIIHEGGVIHRLKHSPGETLLETARRGHVRMYANCELGECGTCMVVVLSGSVEMRANEVLSKLDEDKGLTLACQAVPTTDIVEIEFP